MVLARGLSLRQQGDDVEQAKAHLRLALERRPELAYWAAGASAFQENPELMDLIEAMKPEDADEPSSGADTDLSERLGE